MLKWWWFVFESISPSSIDLHLQSHFALQVARQIIVIYTLAYSLFCQGINRIQILLSCSVGGAEEDAWKIFMKEKHFLIFRPISFGSITITN